MVIVYLDIETSGLDCEKDQIISIQLQEDNNPMEILTSWKSDEKTILKKLIERLKEIQSKGFVICVGFNSLKFDIPFLLLRSSHYELLSPNELRTIFYVKLAHTDLRQILLPHHNWQFKGLKWEKVLEVYGFPEPKGKGEDVPKWFKKKQYDKIIAYVKSEFEPVSDIYWMIRNGDIRTL